MVTKSQAAEGYAPPVIFDLWSSLVIVSFVCCLILLLRPEAEGEHLSDIGHE
eukprot:SAG25_NODE_725_length_5716_cov_7.434752_6_plen_52_part_00